MLDLGDLSRSGIDELRVCVHFLTEVLPTARTEDDNMLVCVDPDLMQKMDWLARDVHCPNRDWISGRMVNGLPRFGLVLEDGRMWTTFPAQTYNELVKQAVHTVFKDCVGPLYVRLGREVSLEESYTRRMLEHAMTNPIPIRFTHHWFQDHKLLVGTMELLRNTTLITRELRALKWRLEVVGKLTPIECARTLNALIGARDQEVLWVRR